MHHFSMSWETTLLYFFSWNFIWFMQKEPIKEQNLRLLTAQVKFHQICTLIGSFCWKYIKFLLKKYRGAVCISWYWRVTQNLRKNRFIVSKMTRIWWILVRPLKSQKNSLLDWSISCKVYNVWPKKIEKLTCGLENDKRNLANFHQNTWKCQNWYFHGILLSKVQNAWAKNLQMSYV